MYGYKINNSYTIYVNYAYLNECRKASTKYKETGVSKSHIKPQSKKETSRVIIPLALETKVHHKAFGDGTVVESDKKGYISICYNDKVKRFLYPQAFEMGFLTKVAMWRRRTILMDMTNTNKAQANKSITKGKVINTITKILLYTVGIIGGLVLYVHCIKF